VAASIDINLAMSPPYFRIVSDQFSPKFAVEGTRRFTAMQLKRSCKPTRHRRPRSVEK